MDDKAIATEENKDNQEQNQSNNQEQNQSNNQPSASSSVRERFTTSAPELQEFEAVQEGQEIIEHAPIADGNYPSTYIEVVTKVDSAGQPLSVLEVDLIISREKGEEKRRLAINFAAIEDNAMVEKSVSIPRESFEALKQFFCQLDWNS